MKFKIMRSKIMNLKMIKSAKISLKLTVIYAVMFSLILLILNVSILYGIKYYLYGQANKQIEDVKTIVLGNIMSRNEKGDLSDKELVSDVTSEQNISIKILEQNGKVLNKSKEFNYKITSKEPFDKIRKTKEDDKHLVYKILKIKTQKYGVIYIQIVKWMGNEYDFMQILFVLMAIADFIGMIASIILG